MRFRLILKIIRQQKTASDKPDSVSAFRRMRQFVWALNYFRALAAPPLINSGFGLAPNKDLAVSFPALRSELIPCGTPDSFRFQASLLAPLALLRQAVSLYFCPLVNLGTGVRTFLPAPLLYKSGAG